MKSGDKSATTSASETAALINEDDLPSWLRAYSDAETKDKGVATEDTSWMVGNEAEAAAANSIAEDLAQSWQSRTATRPAAPQRVSATSAFGKTPEGAAKAERVIAAAPASTPTPAPTPEVLDPVAAMRAANGPASAKGAQAAVRARQAEKAAGPNMQRIAVIAFAVALIIFLLVVGFFVIAPALRG